MKRVRARKGEYWIYKKRSGKFAVCKVSTGNFLNGEEKLKILANEGLIKPTAKKKATEESKSEKAEPAAETSAKAE